MSKIWAELYRPKDLNEYVFSSDEQKEKIQSFVKQGDIPNLLFSGVQGTGKTSLAKCLINELNVDPMDLKVINTSALREHLSTVTDEIIPFCRPLPMGEYRVVLLEEFDRMSFAAQQALRNIIEEYKDRVRFIATCNYPNKIIPAMHSRFQEFKFDSLDQDSIVNLIGRILEEQNINFDDPEIVFNHIDTYYPDLRKIINSIQQSSVNGELHDVMNQKQTKDQLDEWEELWLNGNATLKECRELCQYANANNYEDFFRSMYKHLEKNDIAVSPDKAVIVIAKYLYHGSFVADQDINLNSCVTQLFVNMEE